MIIMTSIYDKNPFPLLNKSVYSDSLFKKINPFDYISFGFS